MNAAIMICIMFFLLAPSTEGAKTIRNCDKFAPPGSNNRTCIEEFGVSVALTSGIFTIGYPYGASCPKEINQKGSILVYPMKNSTIQRPGKEIFIPGSAEGSKRYFGNLVATNERFIVVATPWAIRQFLLVMYIYSAQLPYNLVSTIKTDILIDVTAARDDKNTLYIDEEDDSIIVLPWSLHEPGFVYKLLNNGSRKEWILSQKLKYPAINSSAYLPGRQTVNSQSIITTIRAVDHFEVKAFVFRKTTDGKYKFLQLLNDFDKGQGNPYETYVKLSNDTLTVFLPGVALYKYAYNETNGTFNKTQTIGKEDLREKGYFGAVTMDDKRLLYAGSDHHTYTVNVYKLEEISKVEAVLKLEDSRQRVQKLIIRNNMVYLTTYMHDHIVYAYDLNTNVPIPSSAVSSMTMGRFGPFFGGLLLSSLLFYFL